MYDQVSFPSLRKFLAGILWERGNIPFIRSPLLLIPGGVINGLALKNQLLNWDDARSAGGPGMSFSGSLAGRRSVGSGIMCAWVVFKKKQLWGCSSVRSMHSRPSGGWQLETSDMTLLTGREEK